MINITEEDLAKAITNAIAETGNALLTMDRNDTAFITGKTLESLYNEMLYYSSEQGLKYLIDNYNSKLNTDDIV